MFNNKQRFNLHFINSPLYSVSSVRFICIFTLRVKVFIENNGNHCCWVIEVSWQLTFIIGPFSLCVNSHIKSLCKYKGRLFIYKK